MKAFKHPTCNVVYNPAKGTEDHVDSLPIRCQSFDDGQILLSSFWKPTEYEIALLQKGGVVVLNVLGSQHPPVSVKVMYERTSRQDSEI